MRKRNTFNGAALALSVFSVSCSYSPAENLLARYDLENDVSSFLVCSEYSCGTKQWVSLEESEWEQVRSTFLPASQNAVEERERIREAVALIERLVGPKTGPTSTAPARPFLQPTAAVSSTASTRPTIPPPICA